MNKLAIASKKEFMIIWSSYMISIGAEFLFSLVVSAHIYKSTESLLLSTAVFYVQLIMPVVGSVPVARFVELVGTRTSLVSSEFVSLALCFLIIVVIDHFPSFVLSFLALKGYFDAVRRTARACAVKAAFQGAELEIVGPVYNNGQIVGSLAATCVLAFYGNLFGPSVALAVVAPSNLISGFLYYSLGSAISPSYLDKERRLSASFQGGKERDGRSRSPVRAAASENDLFGTVSCLVILNSFVIGFHMVARLVAFDRFYTSASDAIYVLSLLSSASIWLGNVTFSLFGRRVNKFSGRMYLAVALPIFSIGANYLDLGFVLTAASYTFMTFSYGICFACLSNLILLQTDEILIPRVAAVSYAMGAAGMIMMSVFGSFFAPKVGLSFVAGLFDLSGMIVLALSAIRFFNRRKRIAGSAVE